MKLTGWYSGNQKPVRDGVYERKFLTRTDFSYYSTLTGVWGFLEATKRRAREYKHIKSAYQSIPWRGVAK